LGVSKKTEFALKINFAKSKAKATSSKCNEIDIEKRPVPKGRMNTKYLILNFNFERAFSLRGIITFSFYDFLYLTKKVPKMKLGQISPMQNLFFFLWYRNVQKKSFRFLQISCFFGFQFHWFLLKCLHKWNLDWGRGHTQIECKYS
jgi:hypothetical protein